MSSVGLGLSFASLKLEADGFGEALGRELHRLIGGVSIGLGTRLPAWVTTGAWASWRSRLFLSLEECSVSFGEGHLQISLFHFV